MRDIAWMHQKGCYWAKDLGYGYVDGKRVNDPVEYIAAVDNALTEANDRIKAMEPFQSGWEDPDVTILELQKQLTEANARAEAAEQAIELLTEYGELTKTQLAAAIRDCDAYMAKHPHDWRTDGDGGWICVSCDESRPEAQA